MDKRALGTYLKALALTVVRWGLGECGGLGKPGVPSTLLRVHLATDVARALPVAKDSVPKAESRKVGAGEHRWDSRPGFLLSSSPGEEVLVALGLAAAVHISPPSLVTRVQSGKNLGRMAVGH